MLFILLKILRWLQAIQPKHSYHKLTTKVFVPELNVKKNKKMVSNKDTD